MSWLYHGFNRDPEKRDKQCYYEWHCVYCYLRTLWVITKHSTRARVSFLLLTATAITCTLAFALWLIRVIWP